MADELRIAIAAAVEQVMRANEARAAPVALEPARCGPLLDEHATLQAELRSIAGSRSAIGDCLRHVCRQWREQQKRRRKRKNAAAAPQPEALLLIASGSRT